MDFRLANLCKENNLSYLQLEKILNIPNAKLNSYAKRFGTPNLMRAILIADYFSCSLDYITGLSSVKQQNKLTPPNLVTFKNRLQDLINEDSSIKSFFSSCGLDVCNYSRWKHSEKFPKLSNLYLIAKTKKVSLDYLVGRTDLKHIGGVYD